ncbi:hypothetical protein AMTRI_Chr09g37170 [Amborella trichopoda]
MLMKIWRGVILKTRRKLLHQKTRQAITMLMKVWRGLILKTRRKLPPLDWCRLQLFRFPQLEPITRRLCTTVFHDWRHGRTLTCHSRRSSQVATCVMSKVFWRHLPPLEESKLTSHHSLQKLILSLLWNCVRSCKISS